MTNAELISKIKAEIEKLIERYSSVKTKGVLQEGYKGGRLIGYKDALNILKRIQEKAEENTPNDLEEATEEYCLATEMESPYVRMLKGKAFIAGAKWQKEQMMEEAVEGVVMDFSSNQPRPQVDVYVDPDKYCTGDKVRIIIVKE